jgi:hypothetical protein
MSDAASLSTAIAEQTAKLNELRLQKDADAGALEETKKKLGDLKKALGAINKANAMAAAGSKPSSTAPVASDAKKRERVLLKTAKVRQFFNSNHAVSNLYTRAQKILDPPKPPYVNISRTRSKNASRDMEVHVWIHQFSRGKTS